MPFIHLHVHSGYSLLNSSARIGDLVTAAKQSGFKALALTDENVMYGAAAFYKECVRQGIKPIIGLHAGILDQAGLSFPMILLAKNNKGYQNLVKISSILQTKSKEGIPKKWLVHYSAGLIALTPGLKGKIEQLFSAGEFSEAEAAVKEYKEIFRDGFYFALQRHGLKEQDGVNAMLVKYGMEWGVPVAATNDVHYIEKEDAFVHEVLQAIKHGTKLADHDRGRPESKEHYLKKPREMAELFSDLPDALENTLKICEQCEVELEFGKPALPKYPVPDGESAEEYLARICLKGLRDRLDDPADEYYDRLTYELDIIKKMNFSDYFLIVWDFMEFAHRSGIMTGPGRGSAAGSLVAYALSITDVDPIKHGLLFERFLNPERISMPDIDIDFPDNRRDEMIAYVAEKYGQLHVAQIITFGTLAAKAALRDVGRVMGVSSSDADFISRQVSGRPGTSLSQALEDSSALKEYIKSSRTANLLFETARKIEGLPRHTSTHAAGVVISEKPLTDLVPVQEGHDNVFLTQYPMDILEELGLLKMDFLGLRNLTLIDNILGTIKRTTGKKIDLQSIPYDDPATYELLGAGDTTGIFQLESSGMRKVLTRLRPTELEDIVAVNALYRPGPMENIPVYIQRKHRLEKVSYPHPDLEDILKSTYGVIVYQEQIMQIAARIAGFSLGEADSLRRAVGKKKREVLDQERSHFVAGCMANGYDEGTAHSIYDLIVRFANYGFNRSHAVAYSIIAYQLAYLKANYPLYFMSALLTSVVGNEDKTSAYIRETKQKGIKILPPSINKSGFAFQVENKGIRFSIAAIKNVGGTALRELFQERKKKPFADFFDFCVRIPGKSINRRTLESLIFAGAFDEFGKDRAVLLASVDVALEHSELIRPEDGQMDLFIDEEFVLKPKYVEVEPFRQEEKLQFEKEVLGFYLSSHPISSYKELFSEAGVAPINEIKASDKKSKYKIGAYILNERTIRTKKGEVMAFLTISDETGDMEAVAFPDVYRNNMKHLQKGEILLLEGNTEFRDERIQIIVKNVIPLDELKKAQPKSQPALFLKISSGSMADEILYKVKAVLDKYHGHIPVMVHYEETQSTIQLPEEYWIREEAECLNSLKGLLGEQNVVLKESLLKR